MKALPAIGRLDLKSVRMNSTPILPLAHRDFPLLTPNETVQQALDKFRKKGLPHKIIYFYVTEQSGELIGVLPTRLLLTADLHTKVGDIFVRKAVSLPANATLEDARQAFAQHKFLAFPLVDSKKRVLGVVDIETFAGDLGNLNERTGFDDIYELLGMNLTLPGHESPARSFRIRFPWLIATLVSGSIAAILTSFFQATLEQALILAFFLTLTLGLNESVCMQSATFALQRMHGSKPDRRWFLRGLAQEVNTGVLLGAACGVSICAISFVWKHHWASSLSLGISLFLSVVFSCIWGWTVPVLLRKLQKDPKVAAAPIALGLADLTTLFLYFSVARLLLAL